MANWVGTDMFSLTPTPAFSWSIETQEGKNSYLFSLSVAVLIPPID